MRDGSPASAICFNVPLTWDEAVGKAQLEQQIEPHLAPIATIAGGKIGPPLVVALLYATASCRRRRRLLSLPSISLLGNCNRADSGLGSGGRRLNIR